MLGICLCYQGNFQMLSSDMHHDGLKGMQAPGYSLPLKNQRSTLCALWV